MRGEVALGSRPHGEKCCGDAVAVLFLRLNSSEKTDFGKVFDINGQVEQRLARHAIDRGELYKVAAPIPMCRACSS